MKELNPKYQHHEVEQGKYAKWLEEGAFIANKADAIPFSMVIPPPNVTGKLHLGHAWNTTIQDILARYKRLKGYNVLWLPGMDHAGIATQAKVEQRMREQGIDKYEIGREAFLKKSWEWKEEYSEHIHQQWAKLGLSLDYTRERFTLDDGLSDAVKEVFVSLYHKGLLYRGERIINWDPKLKTALSNIEVVYKETESSMYYFKYYLADKSGYLEVATTRPETMFGDVCVVVNPDDEKFTDFVGKKVINPANGEEIIVIADSYVEIGFGTGAMKCTPAHDPNDFILGEKYGFERIICMNPDGTMNEKAGIYANLDRFDCRHKMVEDLKKQGLLVKIEKHVNQVGYSERSNVIVEPYLSKQWFVKMKPLAEKVIAYQQGEDKIHFYPERFEKTLLQWMENIEDWCVSRQLWWGHRIPCWYHNETEEIYVGVNPPTDSENWHQDEDVLDTWFSSALWPFSTLGWPAQTKDLQTFYPIDVMITAYDIIFFWVARMTFQGIEFTKQKPFKDVLIHGLIRDAEGRKMSKSLGNGIDPNEVIDKYGVDALRHFLISNASPGLDLRFSSEKVEASWNFINKIWNASRFVMMNVKGEVPKINYDLLQLPDKYILSRLKEVIKVVEENMDKYEFGVVSSYLYSFIWDEYCSWYIEMSKIGLNSDDVNIANNTIAVLVKVLQDIIKLLHPILPFVSDEIYSALCGESIVKASWPLIEYYDEEAINQFKLVQEIITLIRNARHENDLAVSAPISLKVITSDFKILEENQKYLGKFCFAESIEFYQSYPKNEKGKTILFSKGELFLPLDGMINISEEIKKVGQQIEKLQGEIKRAESLLANPGFTAKAPQSKIEQEEKKLENYRAQLEIAQNLLEYYQN